MLCYVKSWSSVVAGDNEGFSSILELLLWVLECLSASLPLSSLTLNRTGNRRRRIFHQYNIALYDWTFIVNLLFSSSAGC